jgi:menaquinone-specific isochorismate synthase
MSAEAALALQQPEVEAGLLYAVELEVPRLPLEVVGAGRGEDFGFVWDAPDGERFAASGIAAAIRGIGADRFRQVRLGGARAFAGLEGATQHARCVGGFAFADGVPKSSAWAPFGDALFVLPRWTYYDDPQRPRLVSIAAESPEQQMVEANRQVEQWRGAPTSAPGRPHVAGLTPPDRERWRRQVEAALRAIRAGSLSKVVLADRSRARFADADGVARLLWSLRRPGRRSTRFACAVAGRMFLGASPERLVRLEGTRFATEALAGSIGTGAAAAAILSGSAKDREEHQLVIDAIVAQLEQLSANVQAAEPHVSALSHLQHLRTPIVGTLDLPRHVLELVELLHPTPAVGGVPREAALDWIAATEGASRGWYAGPVGWFDASGDGEFLVALRSALAVGDELEIFAGAGLVRGSDPDGEFEETELKKRAILSAIEVVAD